MYRLALRHKNVNFEDMIMYFGVAGHIYEKCTYNCGIAVKVIYRAFHQLVTLVCHETELNSLMALP